MLSSRRDAEFTDFVAARMTALRRVAYLLCQDRHRADDLVQVAITRLYANWHRASLMDHTEAYVRTIVVREFLSERRSGWARRVSLDGIVPERAGAQPDRDATLDMNAALAGLPPRQRATIVLRFYCDLSVDQVAQVARLCVRDGQKPDGQGPGRTEAGARAVRIEPTRCRQFAARRCRGQQEGA